MRPYLIAILFLTLGIPHSTSAAELVCGSKMIHVGDSVVYVRKQCGEPAAKEQETKHFDYGGRLQRRCFVGNVNIERWIYQLAFGRVSMILTMVDGEVEGIHAGNIGRQRKWQSPCA
jgi:hypothetical protein